MMGKRKYLGISLNGSVSSLSDAVVVDAFGLTDYELEKFREWCPEADKMLSEFRKSHEDIYYTKVYYTLMLDRSFAGPRRHNFRFWIKEKLQVYQTRTLAAGKSYYTEDDSNFEFHQQDPDAVSYLANPERF